MTYQHFKESIKNVIQAQLGPDVKVTIQEITKNNDTHFDGLTILSDHLNISPTIYLNFYFGQYCNGKAFDDICREILSIYRENCPKNNIDISFFTDYDKVKERIVFKLINYERNKALLDKIPHIKMLDLAIVFNCLVEATSTGSATILIYNHHLAFWGITTDDLYELAKTNTPKLLSYDLRDMSAVLKELVSDITVDFDFDEAACPIPMYVLTNHNKLNGSGCILYQNLLQKLSEKLDCDLYILPSSVHEVLLIPADSSHSFENLSDMVKDVNNTQLSREEILSDHVYLYSRKNKQISMEFC